MLESMTLFDKNAGKGVDIDILRIPGKKPRVVIEELTEGDV